MSNKQRLELNWIGKDDPQYDPANIEPRILIEDPEKSYGDENTENMLIHGDNLLALKALEEKYTGKIKCIYIDPPYNTGSAFEHYDDRLEHSTWLSLISPRLQLLWKLLDQENGSIWVSIDDSEMPYLRVLMDELFGRENFIACNIWQKRYSRENREAIGDVHEYVIVYAKSPKRFKNIRNLIEPNEKQKKVYKNLNNDPRGRWRPIPMTAQAGHATKEQFYEITTPTGIIHTPPEGRCWSLSKSTYEKMLEEGRVYFGKAGDAQPNIIRYLSEVKGFTPWTWWPNEEVGHTDEAKKEIHSIFGKDNAFETPKPERLINRIIHIATNPGDIVLDSFLGTGTTMAVAHKMNRKYIGIELGEHAYTHCKPRMDMVIDGEQGGISKIVDWQGGSGYKFYELAPSLLKKDKFNNLIIDEYYNADMLASAMAKHQGFAYNPDTDIYWKQGQSYENDYIYTTTTYLTVEYLEQLHEELKEEESLLICSKSFQPECVDRFLNIDIKKIPQSLLGKCEFAKDDYNFNIINAPVLEDCDWEAEDE